MKRILLACVISTSLIISSIVPAFAADSTGTSGTVKQQPVKKVTMMSFVNEKVLAQYDKAGVDALKAAGVKSVERIGFIMELAKISGKAPVDILKLIQENDAEDAAVAADSSTGTAVSEETDGMEAVAKALGITMDQVKAAREAVKAKITAARQEFLKQAKDQKAAKKSQKEVTKPVKPVEKTEKAAKVK